jgi:hypothetical protein
LFAYKYKDVFNVKIELITDTEFNAFVYKNEDLVWSQDIFKKWFNVLYNRLKPKCGNNKLLKRLLSSLWGSLIKCEKHYFNDEQMESGENEYEIVKERYYFGNPGSRRPSFKLRERFGKPQVC